MSDSNLINEINKRRTFAIISHPDEELLQGWQLRNQNQKSKLTAARRVLGSLNTR